MTKIKYPFKKVTWLEMYKNQHYRSPQNDCFDLFFFGKNMLYYVEPQQYVNFFW